VRRFIGYAEIAPRKHNLTDRDAIPRRVGFHRLHAFTFRFGAHDRDTLALYFGFIDPKGARRLVNVEG
jgi:hypothetical protein